MGVVESARKLGEDEMRLQEMTIEQKVEKPYVFDIEQEMSEADWERIRKTTKELLDHEDWGTFSFFLARIKVLKPEMVEDLSLNDEAIANLKRLKQIEGELSSRREPNFSLIADLSMIFPDMSKELDFISDEDIDRHVHWIHGLTSALMRARETICLKSISLKVAQRVLLNKDDFDEIAGTMRVGYRKGDVLGIESYRDHAFILKMLFPKKFEAIKPDQEAWKKMKDVLKHQKLEMVQPPSTVAKRVNVVDALFKMQILAAEKVVIDENGLRLVMPEHKGDFREKTPARPERKSF